MTSEEGSVSLGSYVDNAVRVVGKGRRANGVLKIIMRPQR